MRILTGLMALAVVAAPMPTLAARDPGLSLHNATSRHRLSGGVGVQAGLTLKLGDRRNVRADQRVRIGLAAGTVVTGRVTSMAGLAISPGRSATFSLGGQPVARHLTQLGAAEAEKEGTSDSKGPSTLGWAAIVAGGVLVAGGVALALVLEDMGDCSDGNCE